MKSTPIVGRAFLALAIMTTAPSLARAQDETCSSADELLAKDHYQRAEALKSMDAFVEAATEYQAAFDLCARPFLLFNVGQMLWRGGERIEALTFYERYLELAPDGHAARIARQRFFEAARAFHDRGMLEESASLYQKYLTYAPAEAHADQARRWLEHIAADQEARREAISADDEIRASEHARDVTAQVRLEQAPPEPWAWTRWDNMSSSPRGLIVGGLGTIGLSIGFEVVGVLADEKGLQTAAMGWYAVSGVLLSSGLLWAYLERSRASTPVVVAPAVGDSHVGAVVSLDF